MRPPSAIYCEPGMWGLSRTRCQSGNKTSFQLDLQDIYFERCDMSDIDFSNADFGSSLLDYTKLDNTILKNIKSSYAMENFFDGKIWWTAKEIDRNLLEILIKHLKPYMFEPGNPNKGYYRDGVTISESDWYRNIHRLCAQAQLTCTDEQMHAEFPKGSDPNVP